MLRGVIGAWLNGRPGRNPQRINASPLLQDLGDMAAFYGNRKPDELVFKPDRATAFEAYFPMLKRINDLPRILLARVGLCQAGWPPSYRLKG